MARRKARVRRERNQVRVRLEDYITVIAGTRKTGKTTIFRDIVEQHYDGKMEEGLLLGFEKGYQALQGIVPEIIGDWEDYIGIEKEIIDDKKASVMGLPNKYDDGTEVDIIKLLCFDTIDEFVRMAEDFSIKELNKLSDKQAKTINAAGGGYGRGKQYCRRLIIDSIQRLSKAGIGLFFIGHSKVKSRKLGEGGEGNEYLQLSCSLTDDYTDLFFDKADMIVFLKEHKTINKETKVANSKVLMHFRSDGEIDCGCRFKYVPNNAEYGADTFLEIFKNAVLKAGGIEEKQLNTIKEEQTIQADNLAKDELIKMNQKTVESLVSDITSKISSGVSEELQTAVVQLIAKHNENSDNTWKALSDANELDRDDILEICTLLEIEV